MIKNLILPGLSTDDITIATLPRIDIIIQNELTNLSGFTTTCTGKSLSEVLIFASTNPQYDDR